jgi:ASC-1-like (ASCH) protein
MKYTDIRREIKSGDILAFEHNSWKTIKDLEIQVVKWFTKSIYSHVGIAWVVGNRVLIIEAVQPLVRIYPLSKCTPFHWIPCGSKYWNEHIEEATLCYVGEEYSKWEAIKAAFNKLKAGASEKWECAELANVALAMGNLLKVDQALSTPADVVWHLNMELGFPIIPIDPL